MIAVLSYVYRGEVVTGALIDAFEYFLSIYEFNKNIKLLLLNCEDHTYRRFIHLIKDRYITDEIENFEKNIIALPIGKLIRKRFEKTLVIDFITIQRTKGILNSEEIIVIVEGFTSQDQYMYSKNKYNVIYYGEMPFEYRDKEYRMKMLFNRYKPLKQIREGIYVNSPFNFDMSFLKTLDLPKKPIIIKVRKHKDNLFEWFDTYLYYHANKWFDPHPRLFLECAYYNKEIIYINNHNIQDGSYYRYNDLLVNGLKERTLSKEDEVIKQFI